MSHTKSDIIRANDFNQMRIKSHTRMALLCLTDPDKTKRSQVNLCVCCFYREGLMAGAAISFKPCGVCEKEVSSHNTHVNKLCDICAHRLSLCKDCGSDLHLKEPRRFKLEDLKPYLILTTES